LDPGWKNRQPEPMIHRFHVLWLIAILASLSVSVLANSFEWVPLKKLPTEADIVAFANRPVFNRSETLSRAEAMRFLTQGTLHTDSGYAGKFEQDRPAGKPMPGCSGVFLAKTGELYFWMLFDVRLMSIVTSEGKRCYISLPQPEVLLKSDPPREDKNSYLTLIPPGAGNVRWFFNDEPPATGASELRSEAQVLSFLKTAKPIKCTGIVEEFQMREDAWLTLSPERAQNSRTFRQTMRGDAIQPYKSFVKVQGILVTKNGKVYYWEQWGDALLCLRDDAGGTCVLKGR
ncbi:MAG: hypothetical protein ABI318_23610, partial [Chthoniobacteraceae bacterium]